MSVYGSVYGTTGVTAEEIVAALNADTTPGGLRTDMLVTKANAATAADNSELIQFQTDKIAGIADGTTIVRSLDPVTRESLAGIIDGSYPVSVVDGGAGGPTKEEIAAVVAPAVWANNERCLTSGPVVQRPLFTQADVREIVRGDTYGGVGNRQWNITNKGGDWPADLSGRTYTLRLAKAKPFFGGADTLIAPVAIGLASGSARYLSVLLTGEETAMLGDGTYLYAVVSASDDGEQEWTVERGRISVVGQIGE